MKIYDTWLARLEEPVWSHSYCRRWAQAVVPIADGERGSGARTILTRDEAVKLIAAFPREGKRLHPDHQLAGIEWLRRCPERANVMLSSMQRHVLGDNHRWNFVDRPRHERDGFPKDFAEHIDHFTFQGKGVYNTGGRDFRGYRRVTGSTPVWRCHMKPDSPYPGPFDYHAASWQQERYGS